MSTEFTFPQARASGGARYRYEDFRPIDLARMAVERTVLYQALREEMHLRAEIAGLGVCGTASPDATIRSRVTTTVAGAPSDTFLRALDKKWREACAAIERVSPLDPQPPRAA